MSWKTHLGPSGARGLEPIFFLRVPTGYLRVPYGFPTGYQNTMFQDFTMKTRCIPKSATGSLREKTGSLRVPYGFPTGKDGFCVSSQLDFAIFCPKSSQIGFGSSKLVKIVQNISLDLVRKRLRFEISPNDWQPSTPTAPGAMNCPSGR